jgi:photosystem II stability/assembly factor-like uncharacterized protein
MVSSTDVWAVGQDVDGLNGVFWHWSGTSGLGGGWNFQGTAPGTPLFSVFMVSPTEGWAVGANGVIFHYFGGTWTSFSTPVSTSLRSVFMLSPTEGWAAGDQGTILHYSGGIWTGPVSPGTTSNNLLSIFMLSGTEGWASGAVGTIVHYAGGAWTAVPVNLVPTAPVGNFNFNSIFYTNSTDGWGVGTAAVILHYDGANFGTVTSPTISNFTSVSFGPPLTGPVNPNDGWAVGNASQNFNFEPTVYHWNGFMWTKGVSIGTQNNLNSVFMLSSGNVWTVGGGMRPTTSCVTLPCPVILNYNGGSWNTYTPPPGSYVLKSVFMVSANEGWAVGEQAALPHPTGIILHYTVTGGVGTWAIFPAPTSPTTPPPLNSVFMLGANEGWAVGDNATILHYTVTAGTGSWNTVAVSGTPAISNSANLTSIFMLSPASGWAVGGVQTPPAAGSPFSAGPIIIYWDGTKWTPVAVPSIPGGITANGITSAMLKSLYFTDPNNGWAVGFPGKLLATVLHWDGVTWSHVTTSPALLGEIPPILTSVYLTGPDDGWIVGASPGFRSVTTKALSTILRFGGAFSPTPLTTTTVISTITSSTTYLSSSTASFLTSISNTTRTVVTITTAPGAIGLSPGIPAFSVIAAGVAFALIFLLLFLLWRRGKRPPGQPVILYPIPRRPP